MKKEIIKRKYSNQKSIEEIIVQIILLFFTISLVTALLNNFIKFPGFTFIINLLFILGLIFSFFAAFKMIKGFIITRKKIQDADGINRTGTDLTRTTFRIILILLISGIIFSLVFMRAFWSMEKGSPEKTKEKHCSLVLQEEQNAKRLGVSIEELVKIRTDKATQIQNNIKKIENERLSDKKPLTVQEIETIVQDVSEGLLPPIINPMTREYISYTDSCENYNNPLPFSIYLFVNLLNGITDIDWLPKKYIHIEDIGFTRNPDGYLQFSKGYGGWE